MRPDATPRPAEPTALVRVEHSRSGYWEVELPDHKERVACETFDDAQRIGYLCAAHAQPCELIVQDAYHRVVQRRLITGAAAGNEPTSDHTASH
jgi:hypothetical protein